MVLTWSPIPPRYTGMEIKIICILRTMYATKLNCQICTICTIYMLSTSYWYDNHISSINDILASMLVQFGTLFPYNLCNKIVEKSVPYVVLNGYVPGCISYDTNMYHIMIAICYISGTENYFGCIQTHNYLQ